MNKNRIILTCAVFAIATITMLASTQDVLAYTDGELLKSPLHSSVYLYKDGTRHAFPSASVYHTWYSNFDTIKVISVEQIESIDLGNPVAVKQNTKLLKFPFNPKIYAVTEEAYLQHIPDAETATVMFGPSWGSNIIELPEIYSLFYTKGNVLDRKSLPKTEEQYSTQTTESKTLSNNTIREDIPKLSHIEKNRLNENGQLVLQEGNTRTAYYYKGTLYPISYLHFDDWYANNMSISILSKEDYTSIGENDANFVCARAGNLIRFHIPGTQNVSNNYLGEFGEDIYYIGHNCIIHKISSENWVKKWYGIYTDQLNPENQTKWTVIYDSRDKSQWQLEYSIGTPFSESSAPVGMTAKDNNGDIWYIDIDGKRLVTKEGLKNNNFFKHLLLNKLDLPLSNKGPLTSGDYFLPKIGLK